MAFLFFSDLLLNSLFKPGYTPHTEHKHKYVFLLAYAASVHETWGEVNIISILVKKINTFMSNEVKFAAQFLNVSS